MIRAGERPRIVIGNWKMNPPSIDECVTLARAVAGAAGGTVAVGVAPPAIALERVAAAVRGSAVSVYAQDVHWEERGAFTGQTAASMVVGLADGAIVGHSEVRRDQCDDDARVGRKLLAVLGAGLRAVLCVGETERQFEAGETERVLRDQITTAFAPLAEREDGAVASDRLVIAYEPVWAIGTGRPATAAHASRAITRIRAALAESGIDDAVPVLYGGSVTAAGVGEFARAEGIDGALVGGASLKATEFAQIVLAFEPA